MPTVYAIDYGTSNSLLAGAKDRDPFAPIPLDATNSDATILRSIMYSPKKGEWHFGNAAIDHYTKNVAEGRLLRSIKKYLPDQSFEGTTINNQRLKLHDIIALFLQEMRNRAGEQRQEDVTHAVMGPREATFGSFFQAC